MAAFRQCIAPSVVCDDGYDTESDVNSEHSLRIGPPVNAAHLADVSFNSRDAYVPQDDMKSKGASPLKNMNKDALFGVLPEGLPHEFDEHENYVPSVLMKLQSRLYELNGLEVEGIFRVAGSQSVEEDLRKALNAGQSITHVIDPHSLASTIKAWLRELPEGVLDALSPQAVAYAPSNDALVVMLKEKLQPLQSALLDWVVNLMVDVVEKEEHNMMGTRNIAMIFSPNMTRVLDPLLGLQHAVKIMGLLQTLIERKMDDRRALDPNYASTPPRNEQRANGIPIHEPRIVVSYSVDEGEEEEVVEEEGGKEGGEGTVVGSAGPVPGSHTEGEAEAQGEDNAAQITEGSPPHVAITGGNAFSGALKQFSPRQGRPAGKGKAGSGKSSKGRDRKPIPASVSDLSPGEARVDTDAVDPSKPSADLPPTPEGAKGRGIGGEQTKGKDRGFMGLWWQGERGREVDKQKRLLSLSARRSAGGDEEGASSTSDPASEAIRRPATAGPLSPIDEPQSERQQQSSGSIWPPFINHALSLSPPSVSPAHPPAVKVPAPQINPALLSRKILVASAVAAAAAAGGGGTGSSNSTGAAAAGTGSSGVVAGTSAEDRDLMDAGRETTRVSAIVSASSSPALPLQSVGSPEVGSRNPSSAPSSPGGPKKGRGARQREVTSENIFDVALQRPSGLRPAQETDAVDMQAGDGDMTATGGGLEPLGMDRVESEGRVSQVVSAAPFGNSPGHVAGEGVTITPKGSSASRMIARAMSADPVNLDKVRPLGGPPGASTSDTGRTRLKSTSVSSLSEARNSPSGSSPDMPNVEMIARAHRMEGIAGAGGGGRRGERALGRTHSESLLKEKNDGKGGKAVVGRRLQTDRKADDERVKARQGVESPGAVHVVRTRKKTPSRKIGDIAVKNDVHVPKVSKSDRSRSVPKNRPQTKGQMKGSVGETPMSAKSKKCRDDERVSAGVSMDRSWEVLAGGEDVHEDGKVDGLMWGGELSNSQRTGTSKSKRSSEQNSTMATVND